jgi:hypothetical protein
MFSEEVYSTEAVTFIIKGTNLHTPKVLWQRDKLILHGINYDL